MSTLHCVTLNDGTVLLDGHTPGHVSFLFRSEGDVLCYTADAAGHKAISLQKPDWRFCFDADSTRAIAPRKRLVRRLVDEGCHSFTPQFPWPAVGKAGMMGDRLVWNAGVTNGGWPTAEANRAAPGIKKTQAGAT